MKKHVKTLEGLQNVFSILVKSSIKELNLSRYLKLNLLTPMKDHLCDTEIEELICG